MVCGWKYSAYFGSIFVDNEEANKSISKTEKQAESLGSKLGDGIKTAAKWGAGLAAGAVAAGTAMFGMASKATDSLDRIDKLSQKIGLSRQGFQEYSYILSQNGTDIEKLQVGFKTLSAQMEMAEKGSGKGAENFKKLGISVTDTTGALKSQEQVFEETVKALQAMPEGAEKSKLAMDLFGRAGQELMPLLNGTTESMEELRQKAHDMGMVISDEAVDAGVLFQDTMDDLKRSFGAIVTNVGASLIPIFQALADWVIEHMPLIQKIIGAVFEFLQNYVGIFIDVIKLLIDTFTNFFTSSEEGLEEFKQYFETFKEWFIELLNLLVEFVRASLEIIKEFWEKHGEEIIAVAQSIWDIIKVVIDTTLKVIKDIIKVVTALIKGDWEGVWEGIKNIFVNVWEGMKKLLPSLLDGIFNVMKASFSIFKDLGKGMFNMVWEGMKSLWTSISNWVSDKVSWLVDKLAFWRKSNAEMSEDSGSSKRISGSHASGLAYVPYDGYVAELHKGEGILTAEENRAGKGSKIENNFNISSLAVREEADIRRIAKELYELQQMSNRGKGLVAVW